jgi:hypothetical protein
MKRSFLIASMLAMMCLGADDAPTSQPTSQPTQAVKSWPKLTKVSIDDLVAAYRDNAIAADEKYWLTCIEVSGKVSDIRSLYGKNYVMLEGGEGKFVQCFFYDKNDLLALHNGEILSIVGSGLKGGIVCPSLGSCYIDEAPTTQDSGK